MRNVCSNNVQRQKEQPGVLIHEDLLFLTYQVHHRWIYINEMCVCPSYSPSSVLHQQTVVMTVTCEVLWKLQTTDQLYETIIEQPSVTKYGAATIMNELPCCSVLMWRNKPDVQNTVAPSRCDQHQLWTTLESIEALSIITTGHWVYDRVCLDVLNCSF